MLKVQETYSEEPIDRYFEMVGVMEDELKDLGYHFEVLDNSFKEDV